MRRFILEIAVLLSLLLVSLYFLDTGHKSAGAAKFENISEKLEIITLGNSHGGASNFGTLALTAASFNRAGNTLYYDKQNYKYLKKYLADSAIIILPVSYFSFGLEENRDDRGKVNPFVNQFYEYLPPNSILGYSIKKDLSLKINRIQKRISGLYPAKNKEQPKKKKKRIVPDVSEKIAALNKSASKASELHKKIFGYGEPSRNVKYLTDLIEDAKKNGYKPILITTPYYKAYNDSFDSTWLKENYYRHMDSISDAHKTIYLDYGHESKIIANPVLFKNSDHLSAKGRIKFSQIFFQDLVQLGVLKKEDIKPSK